MFQKAIVSRRAFVKRLTASAAAVGAPFVIPASALGLAETAAPSNRITVGMIGLGRQCMAYNFPFFLTQPDCEVVALCDVDRWRLNVTPEIAAANFKQWKKNPAKIPNCKRYVDFREVLGRKDVDAVMISTPDHWHVPMSVMAVKDGKDVCCEKPITRSIAEGRFLSDLVTKHKRVFRNDSEFRSKDNWLRTVELVRNGRIGKLHTIRTGVPIGALPSPKAVEVPVPKELDYELWQGPAPLRPYSVERIHPQHGYGRGGWMNIRDYSDGMILNWTAHVNDIAQWGNNTDRTGPLDVEGHGKFPPAGALWDVLYEFEVAYNFANGVKLISSTCKQGEQPYTRFEGEGGWVQANSGKRPHLQAEPASLLESKIGPDELHFPLMHEKRDFLEAVKTRGTTLEDAEVGHRTSSLGHLGLIAIQLGRKLKWDPVKEEFPGDDEANKMRSNPPGRAPWILEQL